MLMPKPVDNQYRKTATASAFQLKKNRAAIAPRWRTTRVKVVIQFKPSCSGAEAV